MEAVIKVISSACKTHCGKNSPSKKEIGAMLSLLQKEGLLTSPSDLYSPGSWDPITAALSQRVMELGKSEELRTWGLVLKALKAVREEQVTSGQAKLLLGLGGGKVSPTDSAGKSTTEPQTGEEEKKTAAQQESKMAPGEVTTPKTVEAITPKTVGTSCYRCGTDVGCSCATAAPSAPPPYVGSGLYPSLEGLGGPEGEGVTTSTAGRDGTPRGVEQKAELGRPDPAPGPALTDWARIREELTTAAPSVVAMPVVIKTEGPAWTPLEPKLIMRLADTVRSKGLRSPITMAEVEAIMSSPLLPHDVTNLMRVILAPAQYALWMDAWDVQLQTVVAAATRDPRHPANGQGRGERTNLDRLNGKADGMAGNPEGQAALLRPGELVAITASALQAFREVARLAEPTNPWADITQGPSESFVDFANRLIKAVEGSDLPSLARAPVIIDCLRQKSHPDVQQLLRAAPSTLTTPGEIIKYVLDRQKAVPFTDQGVASAVSSAVSSAIQPLVMAVVNKERDGRGGSGDRVRGRCYSCGSQGHYQAQCPKGKRPGGSRGRCQLCEGLGHTARSCRRSPREAGAGQSHQLEKGSSPGTWLPSTQPTVSLAMTMEHKDRPLVRVVLTNTGSCPVKQRTTYITALLDSGADVTIISEDDWPADWPLMQAASTQVYGIGGGIPMRKSREMIEAFLFGYPGEASKKDLEKKPAETSKKDPEKTPLLPTRIDGRIDGITVFVCLLILYGTTGVDADVHLLEQLGNLWVTWANRTGQTDFCLSTQSATSPFQTCLVGVPIEIREQDFGGYVYDTNCKDLGRDRLIMSAEITGSLNDSITLDYPKVICLLTKLNVSLWDDPPELQLLGSQSLPNINNAPNAADNIPPMAGRCIGFAPDSDPAGIYGWNRKQVMRNFQIAPWFNPFFDPKTNSSEPFTVVTADRYTFFRGGEYCGRYEHRYWELSNCTERKQDSFSIYTCTARGLTTQSSRPPWKQCERMGGNWINSTQSFNVSEFSGTNVQISCKGDRLGNASGCCGRTATILPPGAWANCKSRGFTKPKALPPNIFLICGDRAWQGIPSHPVGGPCYLGKLTMLAPNHTEILKMLANTQRAAIRRRRSISRLDSTCSDEVQLWSATARIFASILAPGVAAAQALREIERLACWSVKQANLTTSLLGDLLMDVTSIRHAVLQNRAAIDFLLLAHGHGCEDVAGMCCFNLSDHSESIHKKFQLMKEHVNKIGAEKDPIGDWLRGLFGGIGEWGVHLLKGLLLGLVVILLFIVCAPCFLQIMLRCIQGMVNRTINYHVEYKKMQKASRQPESAIV
ncbi:LOW QUALITY PROTEIN: uncharacterized protein LOC122176464 [Lagopus leucura]|uniref:LOW QUALITY PROTEIN: uncharacterized protein LOC122176464 n=1 Tax=Lagopus leucura TaxID=30410 RepID=UPI001C66B1C0|nr:LOW QUALITY PROTEIN: uncharacterized protein LOC122176464 [Lagopus leucura]